MNNPIISVIVPAYNASTYIEKCVNSILSSTIKAIELIVVDDKSEDNTLELLGQFNDNRLKVIPENIRGGVSHARNRGIDNASGEYIVFVDADDWIAPNMFDKLLNAAKTANSDITICNHYVVYPDRQELGCDLKKDLLFTGLDVNQYIQMFMLKGKHDFEPYFPIGQPWGTLYRASIIYDNALRFVDGMQYKEDVIFSLYAAQCSSTIVRINDPLYFYNKCNSGSLTTSGLKKGMLPRIELDVAERTKFYTKFRVGDALFEQGLFQHTFRSFYRNIVTACVMDANYRRCKEIYTSETYQIAFENVNNSYFTKAEKIIYFLIRHNALWFYYFVIWMYVKINSGGRSSG